MTDKKIRIIALDLDGTLTNEKKEIPSSAKEALMRMQEKGVRLCLASGRPPYGMVPLAEELQMAKHNGILLCYNGGHVEDCSTGETLTEIRLDEALLPELKEWQEKSGMTLMTYYKDKIYTENPDSPYVQQSSRNNKMEVVKVSDFVNDTPRPINKCLLVGSPEIAPLWEQRLAEAMEGRMDICRSTPYFIELLPLGIDKGSSLEKLMKTLGMSVEEMMAFGDSFNDITMIKAAGIGIAMGNGEEALKAVADYVTGTNDGDGIAQAIEHFKDCF